uniref:Uncharacterized protein n=1 Tax=Bracon brevicornis TaxID=1563983 RepID=A0A6V7L7C7_9HYME
MDLSEIHAVGRSAYLPTKKMMELNPELQYKITNSRSVKTKFGDSVVATLDDEFTVFLPSRLSKLILTDKKMREEMEQAITGGNLRLKYLGTGSLCGFIYEEV